MKITILAIVLSLAWFYLTAGDKTYHRTISWKSLEEINVDENHTITRAVFSGARYDNITPGVPEYSELFALEAGSTRFTAKIENEVYDIAPDGFERIEGIDRIGAELIFNSSLGFERKLPFALCSFIPARINPYNNQYEILIAFDIIIQQDEETAGLSPSSQKNTASSILANGAWYKFSVYQTGIHRISYNDLQSMGIDPSVIDPRKIRIYGNGGGMLPESLNDFRHEDLAENSIIVEGENDGKFDQQDYILFYGESPHVW
jgi:hypothetical protein